MNGNCATLRYVYIGATVAEAASQAGNQSSETLRLIIFIVGGIITLAAVIFISFRANKELKKMGLERQ